MHDSEWAEFRSHFNVNFPELAHRVNQFSASAEIVQNWRNRLDDLKLEDLLQVFDSIASGAVKPPYDADKVVPLFRTESQRHARRREMKSRISEPSREPRHLCHYCCDKGLVSVVSQQTVTAINRGYPDPPVYRSVAACRCDRGQPFFDRGGYVRFDPAKLVWWNGSDEDAVAEIRTRLNNATAEVLF